MKPQRNSERQNSKNERKNQIEKIPEMPNLINPPSHNEIAMLKKLIVSFQAKLMN